MNFPIVIAAYPRSGSTWFRFVLCNLFHPEVEHDFDSVNKHIPPIDHAPGLMEGISKPLFYKTHGKTTATNVIFLHRHVGDVLESEWWYKRKMYGDGRSLKGYLEDTNYGEEWRGYVDFYFPAQQNIRYEELGYPVTYYPLANDLWWVQANIEKAIEKSGFKQMQGLEKKGFGSYPRGDLQIKFCRVGTSGQWKAWPAAMQEELIEKNAVQLKKLGYT